jgi:hypothetical protein
MTIKSFKSKCAIRLPLTSMACVLYHSLACYRLCPLFFMRPSSIVTFVLYLAICQIAVTGFLGKTQLSLPIQRLTLSSGDRINSFSPTTLKSGRDFNNLVDAALKDDSFYRTSSAMFLISCPLGMLLDNQHGKAIGGGF